jgi:hypothetical protein
VSSSRQHKRMKGSHRGRVSEQLPFNLSITSRLCPESCGQILRQSAIHVLNNPDGLHSRMRRSALRCHMRSRITGNPFNAMFVAGTYELGEGQPDLRGAFTR